MLKPGIGAMGRGYRHINRYRQILGVLITFGLGDFLDNRLVELGLTLFSRKRVRAIRHTTRAERFRMALEELGPTFIKLGQVLSVRSDLLPADYIAELCKLQDEVPPFPYADVREIIRAETGKFPEEIFDWFRETPLAAASIAQVHRAHLRDNGDVVVKVQRPGIRQVIEVDLEILRNLTKLNQRHIEAMGVEQLDLIVEEFATRLERELDFTAEAANIERFARNFAGDPFLVVPKVFRDYTTRRVLVMEYVPGIKASEIDRLRSEGYDLREIARRGAALVFKQVLDHGFFHADPHPGNIFILPGNAICFLDFGAMGRISRREQEDFADLVMHVVRKDSRRAAEAILRITVHTHEPDLDALERDIDELIGFWVDRPLKEIDIRGLLQQGMDIMKRHRFFLRPYHFMMLIPFGTIEGVARRLDPDFEIIREAAPFIRRIRLNRLRPEKITGDMLDSGAELAALMRDFPKEMRVLLTRIRSGELRMEINHTGLEPMLDTHDRIASRITFAIVLAALIIGSSLMVLSNIPPRWFDIPLVGLIGFLIAGLMGFRLLWSILRRGRM